VLETEYVGDEVWLVALVPARLAEELAEFVVDPEEENPAPRARASRGK
jgi:hypothetical protein